MFKFLSKSFKYFIFVTIVALFCANNWYITVNGSEEFVNLNEEFDEKSIIVVLKSSESQYCGVVSEFIDKLYTIEKVESYEDLTELSIESLVNKRIDTKYYNSIKKYLDSIEFKQILKINLNTTSKQEVLDVMKVIETFEEVLSVGPNYVYKSCDIEINDTFFDQQWSLIEQFGIDIDGTWNFTTGSSKVRVGVIDTGIAEHVDLNNNVISGWDYVNNNEITVDDLGGHGTSVAGIIGAVGNNERGMAGINHKISLVPLQTAYDTSGSGLHFYDEIISAIEYVRDLWYDSEQRISIVNCSLSGFGHRTEVLNVIDAYQGLFVWSAGNNGENLDEINGIESFSLDNLISVGAHDDEGNRSIWNENQSSNFGAAVDIFAPGSYCLTTSSASENSYRNFNGTSCAAPHVTGVAALLLSIEPDLTAQELTSCILNGSENITITLPDDSEQNVRKLNAYSALKYLFNYYLDDSYTVGSSVEISKLINNTSTYFTEDNLFVKLIVNQGHNYRFNMSSTSMLDVTLYDSNLNEVDINVTQSNSGTVLELEEHLGEQVYYLKVNFVNSNIMSTINLDITRLDDVHSYNGWKYHNNRTHIEVCNCGKTGTETKNHYILAPTTNLRVTCLGCRYLLNLAYDMAQIGPSSNLVTKVSVNGSYILPNGIVVLQEIDLESYENGTLVFYDKDKLPQVS